MIIFCMDILGWRAWGGEPGMESLDCRACGGGFKNYIFWLDILVGEPGVESLGCRACGEELEKLYFLVGHLGVDVERWF